MIKGFFIIYIFSAIFLILLFSISALFNKFDTRNIGMALILAVIPPLNVLFILFFIFNCLLEFGTWLYKGIRKVIGEIK